MDPVRIYAPDGAPGIAPVGANALPRRAEPARIGVLDNGKPGAAELLAGAAEALAARTRLSFAGMHRKGSAATPCEPALFDTFEQEADLVLTGTAD